MWPKALCFILARLTTQTTTNFISMTTPRNFCLALCFLTLAGLAQNPDNDPPVKRGCGTPVPDAAWDKWFNAKVEEYKARAVLSKGAAANITIPVIVHVIHGGQNPGTYPNISQAQVNSQLPTLNADFAGTGFNVGTVPAVFAPLVANTGIGFCFAKLDPNGNCLAEPGIDRVDYRTISGATNPSQAQSNTAIMGLMDNVIKPATIWDPSRYLNIWVSDVGAAAQILGYATMPAGANLVGIGSTGNSVNDGVWVWGKAFGSTGSAQAPYNRGRTTTHEVGHWLGLRHTWGDATCGTDYCNDTPPSEQDNFGCSTHPHKLGVCSGNTTGEMFMNFMDYSNDACLYMFTPDQNSRMQTAMTTGAYRTQLNSSSAIVCNEPAASAPSASFVLSNYTHCVDSTIFVTNGSTGGPCPTYQWVVKPAGSEVYTKTTTNLSAHPSIKFTAPGTYTLELTASNSGGISTIIEEITIYDCFNFTGLKKEASAGSYFALWPNPAGNEVYLRPRAAFEQVDVKIYNALGQQVFTGNYQGASPELRIPVDKLEPGIYTVSAGNGRTTEALRLIINR